MTAAAAQMLEDGSVSAQEAARQLGVSVWTVYRMVDAGELAGHRVRKRAVRVSQAAISDYKARHSTGRPERAGPAPRPRRPVRTQQYNQAVARLAKLGISF